jgi:tetratricopeptide (TPR) repeat protein
LLHYARFYPFAALASLLIVAAARTFAAVALEASVESQPIPERVAQLKLAQPPAAKAWKEKILLDADRVVVEDGEHRIVIDLAARRRYLVDVKAGTYTEWSLYANPGFRVYELENREALARSKDEMALAEHELSIAHARTPGMLEVAASADAVEFKVGELAIFRMSREGSAISDRDARSLGRYFRYFKGGHPSALAALEAQKNLPAQVVMTSNPFQAMRTTLRFSVIPADQAPRASLQGLRKIAPAGLKGLPDELARAAFRISGETEAVIARRAQDTYRQAAKYWQEGNAPAGFFASLEYNLQKGVLENDLLIHNRPAVTGSRELAGVLPHLGNSKDKEAAERAIAALRQGRAAAGPKAYVIGIFEANHEIVAGRPARAHALFVEALRANPDIAGVWKDLGDLLYRQFMPAEAWLCWDTGRKLAPQFGNFEPVNRFEQQLARDHPEYF